MKKKWGYLFNFFYMFVFLLLILISINSCSDTDNNNACFECKMPFLDSIPGKYKISFDIYNSPITNIISNNTYWIEIEYYDCNFTGNCTDIYNTDCPNGDNEIPYCKGSSTVCSCKQRLVSNIPSFNEKEYINIDNINIEIPFECNDECFRNTNANFKEYYNYDNVSKLTDFLSIFVYAYPSSPYCEETTKLKNVSINLKYCSDINSENRTYYNLFTIKGDIEKSN